MVGKFMGILAIGAMLLVVAWIILSCVANIQATPKALKAPDAQYNVVILNAGTHYMANKIDSYGTTVGSRVFILHGYWELVGTRYNYRSTDLPLDEKLYGRIDILKITTTPTPKR